MIAFWVFMMVMTLLTPLVMIYFGRLYTKQAPREINYTFGYRTDMSMKNRDTWEFAHRYIGKLWFRLGLALLPVSVIPMLLVFSGDVETVGVTGLVVCGIQLVPAVCSIIPVEMALNRTFDKNGIRKQG